MGTFRLKAATCAAAQHTNFATYAFHARTRRSRRWRRRFDSCAARSAFSRLRLYRRRNPVAARIASTGCPWPGGAGRCAPTRRGCRSAASVRVAAPVGRGRLRRARAGGAGGASRPGRRSPGPQVRGRGVQLPVPTAQGSATAAADGVERHVLAGQHVGHFEAGLSRGDGVKDRDPVPAGPGRRRAGARRRASGARAARPAAGQGHPRDPG